jgi:hypothetical protein
VTCDPPTLVSVGGIEGAVVVGIDAVLGSAGTDVTVEGSLVVEAISRFVVPARWAFRLTRKFEFAVSSPLRDHITNSRKSSSTPMIPTVAIAQAGTPLGR